MSTHPTSYTVTTSLLGLREADVRRKGEQKGSVRRKGHAWYISFHQWQPDETGNLRYVPVERKIEGTFANSERGKRAAELAGYEQWVSKANALTKTPQGLATVEQFYDARFVVDHVAMLKKSGRCHYANMWKNHIKPSIGSVQLREVSPQMLQAIVAAKIQAGYSTQTVAHIRNCISAIFRHARGLKFFEGELPTEAVHLPEIQHKERSALTWGQVRMLADAMPLRYRPLVLVLSQTGLRIGEACGLRWADVNVSDEWRIVEGYAVAPNSLLVRSNWTHGERTTPKSKRSWRTIPMNSEAWVAFMEQWEASEFRGEDQPVFASRTGTPLDAHNLSNRALKAATKKIGMPWVTFHSLRHTAATLADKAGLSSAEKQKVLGHATEAMSTHYTHPEMERVRAAMEQMTVGRVN